MHCLAVSHVPFEDLGTFEAILVKAGFTVEYCRAGVDELPLERWIAADLAVVLGGPIGVNQHAAYPCIANEISLIQARLAAAKPLLGVCLGAQLIASALGAAVYPGPEKEIGWKRIKLTDAGLQSALSVLDGVSLLHWHGDTFDLPEGATLLASTELVSNQAFTMNGNVMGLQFHAEADPGRFEQWLIGHACELEHAGIDPRELRAGAARYGPALHAAAETMMRKWLADIGLAR